jgi:hypothetical protein
VKALFKSAGEVLQGNTHGPANFPYFEDIQSSLPILVLADERLRLAELPGKIDLAQVGLTPHFTKEGFEFPLMDAVDALIHDRTSIKSVAKYPKIGYEPSIKTSSWRGCRYQAPGLRPVSKTFSSSIPAGSRNRKCNGHSHSSITRPRRDANARTCVCYQGGPHQAVL